MRRVSRNDDVVEVLDDEAGGTIGAAPDNRLAFGDVAGRGAPCHGGPNRIARDDRRRTILTRGGDDRRGAAFEKIASVHFLPSYLPAFLPFLTPAVAIRMPRWYAMS